MRGTRVPLAERRACEPVLRRRQDLVADVLVEGHVAGQRRPALEHAGAEHRVGLPAHERGDHVADELGGVLPVAVEQDHDVPTVVERVLVSRLLVAAVAEVAGMPDDGDGDVVECVVGLGDSLGVVGREVVLDQDLGQLAARVGGNAVEHPRERRLRVVGDDENPDLHQRQLPQLAQLPTQPA